MQRYALDTSAILTLHDDEHGADRVAEVLRLAQRREAQCCGSFITLMEVLYRVWRDQDEAAGRLAYQQCLALPVEWMPSSEALLLQAARFKAEHPLSLADAWIAATAAAQSATLIHKDPEFSPLPLAQEMLPLKAAKPQAGINPVKR
jgi:ribonuclease VapC